VHEAVVVRALARTEVTGAPNLRRGPWGVETRTSGRSLVVLVTVHASWERSPTLDQTMVEPSSDAIVRRLKKTSGKAVNGVAQR
jgi:hypothetical protein